MKVKNDPKKTLMEELSLEGCVGFCQMMKGKDIPRDRTGISKDTGVPYPLAEAIND